MHHPTDRIAHTTAFVIPVMEHWMEQKIAQMDPSTMKDRSDDPLYPEQMLYLSTFKTSQWDGAYKRTLSANQKE